eukprot:359944-Chlamydomonas_euryale.AAC.8
MTPEVAGTSPYGVYWRREAPAAGADGAMLWRRGRRWEGEASACPPATACSRHLQHLLPSPHAPLAGRYLSAVRRRRSTRPRALTASLRPQGPMRETRRERSPTPPPQRTTAATMSSSPWKLWASPTRQAWPWPLPPPFEVSPFLSATVAFVSQPECDAAMLAANVSRRSTIAP